MLMTIKMSGCQDPDACILTRDTGGYDDYMGIFKNQESAVTAAIDSGKEGAYTVWMHKFGQMTRRLQPDATEGRKKDPDKEKKAEKFRSVAESLADFLSDPLCEA